MTEIRSTLRISGLTVKEVVDSMNTVLARLQGQDRRRYGVEPARKPIQSVSANYAAGEGDMVIRVDATGGGRTITLPPAASMKGLTLFVKKLDATANAVTVDADGGELIDGATTAATTTQYAVLRLLSNGSSWDLL